MSREGNGEKEALLDDVPKEDVETGTQPSVQRATQSQVERQADESMQRASDSFARTYVRKANSPYGRMFMYNKNWTFAQCFELSARGAIVLLVFATPLIFNLQSRKGSFFESNELFSTGAIVMFVYTLYLSFGDTISFALAGMFGTILADMAAWIMFGIYDQGYQAEETGPLAWYFGAVFGTLFVVVTLTLNFSTLTQVFSLSNFVWHWMTFMVADMKKRDVTNIFGYDIHLFGFEGILTAFGGCLLALAAISLPYPILALSKACDVAEDIAVCIGETWDTAIEFYCSQARVDHRQTKLKQEMRETQGYIGYLQGYVDSSWWESIFIPKWRRIRLMLFHLNKVSKEAFDRLMHVMLRSSDRETFDKEHTEIMGRCRGDIQKVVQDAKVVLTKCMEAANNGGVNADKESALEADVAEVKKSMKKLTQTFLTSKKEMKIEENSIGKSLIDEHVFVFEVCVFGRIVTELAEKFVSDARARRGEKDSKGKDCERLDKESNEWAIVGIIKSFFDPEVVLDHEHLNFALRNSISILLGFTVGYLGYHKVIRHSNAGIASTAAVLLSRYGGSAITKNLNRLLGVAIGELAGELIYAMFGWCTWWGYTVISIVTFFWTFAMLFTYYNSPHLGSVACLMAAFGTQKFLQGCNDEWVNPVDSYHAVINCVISIGIMMTVDVFFGLGAPSKKAYAVFLETWDRLAKNVQEVFSAEEDSVHEFSQIIVADLGKAAALSGEAQEEPRYWKTPWKADLFDRALKCAYGARLNLICIIYAVADEEGCLEEDTKEAWYQKLLKANAFVDIRDGIETMLQQVRLLSQVFMHEEVYPMPELNDPIMDKNPSGQINDAIDRLVEEASTDATVLEQKDSSQFNGMEEDGPAQLCFVISCIKSLVQDMQDFKFEVLASGPGGPA